MSTPETIYYQQGNVLVSNARAVLDGTTYPLRNITSVAIGTQTPSPAIGCALLLIGMVALAYGIGGNGTLIPGLVGTVLFIGLGIAIFVGSKNHYYVKISSSSGEQRALVSRDKAEVEKVVGALNEAIVKRG